MKNIDIDEFSKELLDLATGVTSYEEVSSKSKIVNKEKESDKFYRLESLKLAYLVAYQKGLFKKEIDTNELDDIFKLAVMNFDFITK